MTFNSFEFLVFLIIVLAILPMVRRSRQARWGFIFVASLIFYGWWDWRFVFLLLFSGLIDYIAALAMYKRPALRKPLLIISLIGNLGSLAVFKYLDFGLAQASFAASWFGIERHWSAGLILPVGISFYTFQSMSYTIDVYLGRLTPTAQPLKFFAYLAMFPQLVAGPIVRARDLLPQLDNPPSVDANARWQGLRLVAAGLFKKVVIADNLGVAVAAAFAGQIEPGAVYWWLIAAMFAAQIYCDFSGYSDIACGVARWMGYQFPRNFDHPYTALGFRDFWARWHISLSSWFRDYVYIPLGGGRRGAARNHLNLWITFLLSGLWHGADWKFVIWGAIHAGFLSMERATDWTRRLGRIPGGWVLVVITTFAGALLAWVFFAAPSVSIASAVVVQMLNPASLGLSLVREKIHIFHLLLLAGLALRETHVLLARKPWRQADPDAALKPAPDTPTLTTTPLHPAAAWPSRVHQRISNATQAAVNRVNELAARAGVALEPAVIVILLTASVYLRGPSQAFIYFQF